MDASPLTAGKAAVVFDAYGTLFDVHAAVQRHADAVGPDAPRLSEIWRNKQLEYSWITSLMGRYRSFWSMTEEALDYALARHPRVDRALRDRLLDAYRDLAAYPEVPETLRRLRASGLRTAILSNGNAEMLARAVASAGLGDHLDAVLSVDAARVFKTAPAAYAIVLDHLELARADVLFCSSNRWDVAGAASYGFATAWLNRTGLPDEYAELPPDAVIGNLDALV
ncbi:haloacid dehalogenase type II [Methylobacterium soli]|uniref:(S)-2-haloacid dehalogenase n=1 Tax=Methylobacterium soli TaxID=553447 RepID=A0A6L3SWI9_9HYPH|nr:haloacid dehalogenase type II [Methylobacterium soli]KAB1078167.1 haloacid dehalogenase type II [Methylobacterium soli]GJE42126.1 (S)-2-haloacid dehalogenase 4A [Methylobacterium soli]